jgi:hypothetical protein
MELRKRAEFCFCGRLTVSVLSWLLVAACMFAPASGFAQKPPVTSTVGEPWVERYTALRDPSGGCLQLADGQASSRRMVRRDGPSLYSSQLNRNVRQSRRFRQTALRYEPRQQPGWSSGLTLYPVCSESLLAPRQRGLHIHLLGSVGLQRIPESTTDVGAIAVSRSGLPTLGALLPVWYDVRLRRSIFQIGAGGAVDMSRSVFDMVSGFAALGMDLEALSFTRGMGWPFVALHAGMGVRYKGLIHENVRASYLWDDATLPGQDPSESGPRNRRGLYLGLLVTTKLGPLHLSIYARYFNRVLVPPNERERREELASLDASTGFGGDGSDGRPPDQLRLGLGIDLYATISSLVELGLGRGAQR